MERIVIIIIAGVVGGLIAQRMHFPGGAIVGSMLASGIAAVVVPGHFVIPGQVSTVIQIMLGISLGMTFERSSLALIPKIIPLAMVSTFVLVILTLFMAYCAQKIGVLDSATALFGLSPGGMSGMALMAQSEGFRTDIVAMLHTFRIFTLFLVVPLLGRVVNRLFG